MADDPLQGMNMSIIQHHLQESNHTPAELKLNRKEETDDFIKINNNQCTNTSIPMYINKLLVSWSLFFLNTTIMFVHDHNRAIECIIHL